MFCELAQRYQDHTHIYTDGSKTQNGTGYAIVVEHSIIKVKLHPDTSILTVEINALKYALKITTKYYSTKFVIFCDSAGAIASISNQWSDSTTIHECQNTYIESTKNNNSITLVWIPSHTGIEMNEKADKAAREVANSTVLYHNTSQPLDSLLDHLKQKIKDHWNKQWFSIEKPRLLTIKEDFYKKIVPPTLNRRNQVITSRIIIGHTKITHRFLLTKEDQPSCEWF